MPKRILLDVLWLLGFLVVALLLFKLLLVLGRDVLPTLRPGHLLAFVALPCYPVYLSSH